jgi:hypothetical protein
MRGSKPTTSNSTATATTPAAAVQKGGAVAVTMTATPTNSSPHRQYASGHKQHQSRSHNEGVNTVVTHQSCGTPIGMSKDAHAGKKQGRPKVSPEPLKGLRNEQQPSYNSKSVPAAGGFGQKEPSPSAANRVVHPAAAVAISAGTATEADKDRCRPQMPQQSSKANRSQTAHHKRGFTHTSSNTPGQGTAIPRAPHRATPAASRPIVVDLTGDDEPENSGKATEKSGIPDEPICLDSD